MTKDKNQLAEKAKGRTKTLPISATKITTALVLASAASPALAEMTQHGIKVFSGW